MLIIATSRGEARRRSHEVLNMATLLLISSLQDEYLDIDIMSFKYKKQVCLQMSWSMLIPNMFEHSAEVLTRSLDRVGKSRARRFAGFYVVMCNAESYRFFLFIANATFELPIVRPNFIRCMCISYPYYLEFVFVQKVTLGRVFFMSGRGPEKPTKYANSPFLTIRSSVI